MDNSRFVNDETIPLVQDEDYDDCNIQDTGRTDVTLFKGPDIAEVTSTLKLTLKVKGDKLTKLYRHLNVTGDTNLADRDRFMIKRNSKTGNTDLLFFDGKHSEFFTNKCTSEFFAAKT